MPLNLHKVIVPIVVLARSRSVDISEWSGLPSLCSPEILKPISTRGKFGTPRNVRYEFAHLRAKAKKKTSQFGVKIENGQSVEILEELESDDGHPMYKIKSINGNVGYIYAMNVQ